MADEFDRRIIPDFLQTTLTVSLGAAFRGFEMLRSPTESLPKMVAEMKTLLSVPENSGDGLQQKIEAMAGVWLEKGANIVTECKTTGERFTEGR